MELLEDKSKYIKVTATSIPPNNFQHPSITLSIYCKYPINEKNVISAYIHPININFTKTFIQEISSFYDTNPNKIVNTKSL